MSIPEAPTYTLIRDLPASDRPRERLRDSGPDALSSAELLAILLRVGGSGESALSQATRLLHHFEGLPGLFHASFAELCNEKGLGEAKASQIKAAIALGMRLAREQPAPRTPVRSPEELVAPMLVEMSMLPQEHVRVVLLDVRSQLVGTPITVYVGSPHSTHVRIADLLSDAIRAKAPSIVLLHNHPSGDPAPSAADGKVTRELYDAAKLMDIALLDHIVIGGGKYVSMKAIGLGFPKDSRAL
jgi:DNA repair protein RadC